MSFKLYSEDPLGNLELIDSIPLPLDRAKRITEGSVESMELADLWKEGHNAVLIGEGKKYLLVDGWEELPC